MKKTIITITFFLLFLNNYGQDHIAFYDASYLKLVVNANGGKFRITASSRPLFNYFFGSTLTDAQLTLQIQANPFLSSYFEPPGIAGAFTAPPSPSFSISSIGGLNVTNFADGLAKFLVKRFKEELTIAFFKKFKDKIAKSNELQTLFPQTYTVLLTVDKDIYQFNIYLNSLREAFIKDLSNLYVNFKKAEQLPSFQNYFNDPSHLGIKTVVSNAFYFIDQYANGIHPGDVIANYEPDLTLFFSDANLQLNIRSSVKVLQLISNSLKSQSTTNYWVPADSVKLLLEDPVGRDLYFGLLYQKGTAYTFNTRTGNHTFSDLLDSAHGIAAKIDSYKTQIEDIIDNAQEVNEYVSSLKTKKKAEIDYNDYYKLFNASLDILQKGLAFTDLAAVDIDPSLKNNIGIEANKWISMARNAGELYVDVRTKNYSSAIINTTSIIDLIFQNSVNNDLRDNILKYGSFAAAVAQAQNSDDVEKAIEAVALPAGSYSVKRESTSNISLNAFVGGYLGVEDMPTLKRSQQWAYSAGLSAPVGVAFSWGIKCHRKLTGGSFSVFLPLIDIGALASFRINDDNSKVASEITLSNIISPGVYFYWGLPKSPVSVGLGGQLGPQLRNVTTTDINIDRNYYLRFGLNIVVDIPVLNLSTKSK